MDNDIDRTIAVLRHFQNSLNLFDIVSEAVKSAKIDNLIIKKNQKQLSEGKNSLGEDITPPYSAVTVAFKKAKGQPADRVTLKDTGEFYESIKVTMDQDGIKIEAQPFKTDPNTGETTNLFDKYGEEVIGLTQNHVNQIISRLKRPIKQALNDRKQKALQVAG